MSTKRVIAIMRADMLGALEARLKRLQVGGITVSRVKGYGAYKNLYTSDWLARQDRNFPRRSRDALIEAMQEVAHADPPGGDRRGASCRTIPSSRYSNRLVAPAADMTPALPPPRRAAGVADRLGVRG